MYNLTVFVDTAHPYFVSQGQWLMHNNLGNCPTTKNVVIDELKKLSTKGGWLDVGNAPAGENAVERLSRLALMGF